MLTSIENMRQMPRHSANRMLIRMQMGWAMRKHSPIGSERQKLTHSANRKTIRRGRRKPIRITRLNDFVNRRLMGRQTHSLNETRSEKHSVR